MASTTSALTILYVTEERARHGGAVKRLDSGRRVDISPATPAEARDGAGRAADCVLLGDGPQEWTLEAVRGLQAAHPSLPVVAFVGTAPAEAVSEVLAAGAEDVIQSTADRTPVSVVTNRIERALDDAVAAPEPGIVTGGPAVVFEWGTGEGWPIEYVSENVERLLGTPPEALVGERYADLIDEADRDRVAEEVAANESAERFSHDPYRIVTADGDRRWVKDTTKVLREDGEVRGYLGYLIDITERKRRERELRETSQRLQAVIEASPNAIIVSTMDGVVEMWNPAAEAIFGWSSEEVVGEQIPIIPADKRAEFERHRDQMRDGEAIASYGTERLTASGERIAVSLSGAPIRDAEGEIVGSMAVFEDVTERQARKRELEEATDRMELALAGSDSWIWEWDLDTDRVTQSTVTDIHGGDQRRHSRSIHDFLEEIHPADRQQFYDARDRAVETGEKYHNEFRLQRDGETRHIESRGQVYRDADGEPDRLVGIATDVTERKRRDQKIAEQRDELARLNRINGIIRDIDQALVGATSRAEIEAAVCDQLTAAGRYRFALTVRPDGDLLTASTWTGIGEDYAKAVFPVIPDPEQSPALNAIETGEVQVIHNLDAYGDADWHEAALGLGIQSLAAIPVTYGDRRYGVISVYTDETDEFSQRELDVLGELGETVGHAVAAAESRERERILTALYEATQDLLVAGSETEISEVVVDAAADVLPPSGIGVYLFDDGENVLWPAATTGELRARYGDVSHGPGSGSTLWEAYAAGEGQFVAAAESDGETRGQNTLVLPLGDHGVFVAASSESAAFDDQKRQLVGLLAATTEAALDRAAGEAGIRERDRALAERTRQLEQTEHVLGCLRDVVQLIWDAGTREEIERGVCERVTEIEPYAFAWIGAVAPDADKVEPRAWAGTDGGYLDDAALSLGSEEPAAVAAATGSPTVVGNVVDSLREAPWARPAVDREFQSVAAVPLVYGGTTYGVLGVYATAPDAFDERDRAVLAEIGRAAAHGINSAETKRGILAECVTELELEIPDPGTFLNAVSELTGSPVTYREAAPDGPGTARVLFSLPDPPVEEVLALESELVAVESLTRIERPGEDLFRATLSGPTVAATLTECGGVPADVEATATSTRVRVQLPQELDIRVFLDRVRESYPGTELRSRRDRDRRSRANGELCTALDERLTERQREVLVTAFESGFFESPRETTGTELAELLGISQPTVTHHLREAQRRLFAALFDGDLDN